MTNQAKNGIATGEQQGYGVEVRPGMLVEVVDQDGNGKRRGGVVLSVAEHGAFVRLDRPETVSVVGVVWDDVTIKAAAPVPVAG